MIRHISIFTLNDKKDLERVTGYVKECGEKISCAKYNVRTFHGFHPDTEMPVFGDVMQEILFNTEEEAAAYPSHPAHIELSKKTEGLFKCVTAFDCVEE